MHIINAWASNSAERLQAFQHEFLARFRLCGDIIGGRQLTVVLCDSVQRSVFL